MVGQRRSAPVQLSRQYSAISGKGNLAADLLFLGLHPPEIERRRDAHHRQVDGGGLRLGRCSGGTAMAASCPQCKVELEYGQASRGVCPHCHARICIPKSYFLPASVAAAVVAIVVIVSTASFVLPQDAVFPYVGMWLSLVSVVFVAAQVAFVRIWALFYSPPVERFHDDDSITRLHLD